MPRYRPCAGCGKQCAVNRGTSAHGPLCRACYAAVCALLRRLELAEAGAS